MTEKHLLTDLVAFYDIGVFISKNKYTGKKYIVNKGNFKILLSYDSIINIRFVSSISKNNYIK